MATIKILTIIAAIIKISHSITLLQFSTISNDSSKTATSKTSAQSMTVSAIMSYELTGMPMAYMFTYMQHASPTPVALYDHAANLLATMANTGMATCRSLLMVKDGQIYIGSEVTTIIKKLTLTYSGGVYALTATWTYDTSISNERLTYNFDSTSNYLYSASSTQSKVIKFDTLLKSIASTTTFTVVPINLIDLRDALVVMENYQMFIIDHLNMAVITSFVVTQVHYTFEKDNLKDNRIILVFSVEKRVKMIDTKMSVLSNAIIIDHSFNHGPHLVVDRLANMGPYQYMISAVINSGSGVFLLFDKTGVIPNIAQIFTASPTALYLEYTMSGGIGHASAVGDVYSFGAVADSTNTNLHIFSIVLGACTSRNASRACQSCADGQYLINNATDNV